MIVERPAASEVPDAYEEYVSRVPEGDALPALERQIADVRRRLGAVSEERAGFRYAPDKWSVREVLGHLIDTERVFGYRALCIARGDATPLPGFDENAYAASSGHDRRTLATLLDEFEAVRRSHVALFAHLDPPATRRAGTANGRAISVRALAYVLVGHARHHLAVLEARYGVEGPS
jgi:hypothetical protein